MSYLMQLTHSASTLELNVVWCVQLWIEVFNFMRLL